MSIASTGLSCDERRGSLQTTEPTQPPDRPQYLDVLEAAAFLRTSKSNLGKMRCQGNGPRYTKATGRILYRLDHLIAWADQATFTSTADEAARLGPPLKKRGRPKKVAVEPPPVLATPPEPAPPVEPEPPQSRRPRREPIKFTLQD
jgi:hypothetical protein